MLEVSKPPRKPIRSKCETDGQYREKLKKREAKKPPPIEGETSGDAAVLYREDPSSVYPATP
jgi:hypothetical protein